MEKRKTHAFLHFGLSSNDMTSHFVACEDCAKTCRWADQGCPMCRQPCINIVRILKWDVNCPQSFKFRPWKILEKILARIQLILSLRISQFCGIRINYFDEKDNEKASLIILSFQFMNRVFKNFYSVIVQNNVPVISYFSLLTST